ncbi:polysaccharide biosynthesis/export family protein [Thiolapillus brandeum]|uniref:Polysaccharide export outer membrane protein n=1 Tax=Thiolapillus brandeum TaxID=1076588 RepID=A0A7U6GHD5_9GAMM|nr:polysaccharide biosynthesis/export family protein [Thiolapillus brandeum]BAO43666.1 polysaccharide export outer membrane protein [Thiolapillus brandeum]
MKSSTLIIMLMTLLLPLAAGAEGVLDDLSPGYASSSTSADEVPADEPIRDFSVAKGPGPGDEQSYEYRIGPLDLIEVEVFQAQELSRETRVNTEGYASLPLIGPVKVAGLTAREAERAIERVLKEKYLQDPHVTVFIKEYESQKITVEGWVKNPGVFPLRGKTTFLQAIANAKGMDRLADFDEVAIFRTQGGKTTGYVLSYRKVRAGEQADPVLHSGDIIVVNRSGSKAAWKLFSETLTSFVGWSVLF